MTVWRGEKPLILASQSRARRMVLENAGLGVEAIPADIDERAVAAAAGFSDPAGIARELARAKAMAVAKHHADACVIGADQTLALGAQQFHKPAGRGEAAAQLKTLAGRTHALHSAVCVVDRNVIVFDHVASAYMTMRAMDDRAIEAYLGLAGDAVTTSVGAYQLEALGVHLFDKVDGDHFTILGLPLLPLLDFFRSEGLLAI